MQAPPSTYNSGEDAITRSLDVVKETTPSSLADLENAFDIVWTASVIEERKYSRVLLLPFCQTWQHSDYYCAPSDCPSVPR